MAVPTATSSGTTNRSETGNNNSIALYSLMLLFFMMGFITCLNDILIPYLKAIFQLSYAQANLVNL
jgi:MFS transporter, FHS family, L-fucose permease